jgi:hypothetical protein
VPKFYRNILPPSSGAKTEYENMNLNCLENFEIDERFETLASLALKKPLVFFVAPFVAIQITDVLERHDPQ